MFERFTAGARRVLVRAQEEARRLGHPMIDTDHLLLGILDDDTSAGGPALRNAGLSADALRDAASRRHEAPGSRATGSPPFSPNAKKALELSLRAALERGDDGIGSEHLLLGILRQADDPAIEQLTSLGVDVPALQRLLQGTPSAPATASGSASGLSPAAGRILHEARLWAGSAPLRSHDLLRAMFEDPDSAATKALSALGVTKDDVQRALDGIDLNGTTDST